MLPPELTKLKDKLESGEINISINREELLSELKKLDNDEINLNESLSLSDNICPTCGRRLN